MTAALSSSSIEPSAFRNRFRSISQLPNHLVVAQLRQLNQQSHWLEAELLLFLGELDRRQLYREQAVASAFEYCVSRLGYSEDVAWKRVGAARMMRQFPRIYALLTEGRIHLTALMLLRPHLTEDNHEEWLLAACNRSKRQVEKLVASRCPRPDVPTGMRKLPTARLSPAEASPPLAAGDLADRASANGQQESPSTQTMAARMATASSSATTAAATSTATAATTATALPARMAPLSSNTYRVTFTACERLKQKLDRAGELLSHCINPSDLPALIERALDGLLEREEKRRYGARPISVSRATECALRDDSLRSAQPSSTRSAQPSSTRSAQPSSARAVGLEHESCHAAPLTRPEAEDPDPVSSSDCRSNAISQPEEQQVAAAPQRALTIDEQRNVTAPHHAVTAKSKRRRCLPVGVRRAVFERDGGQCTFVDSQGRRCSQRHFLEFDHIDPHALGGPETVSNLRLQCSEHNRLEAEKLFGRARVKSAVKHAKQERSRRLSDDHAW